MRSNVKCQKSIRLILTERTSGHFLIDNIKIDCLIDNSTQLRSHGDLAYTRCVRPDRAACVRSGQTKDCKNLYSCTCVCLHCCEISALCNLQFCNAYRVALHLDIRGLDEIIFCCSKLDKDRNRLIVNIILFCCRRRSGLGTFFT